MIMDSAESISVIIPAYNCARFVGDAIESVLNQTVQPDEVIVVDDGSTDETESVVEKFNGKVRYVYQENAGASAARNTGLDLAKGDLVSFIDADDIWVENKLEMQLDLLYKNPEFDIIIGLLYRIPIEKTDQIIGKKIEGGEHATSLGSSLMKKEVFDKIGRFDEDMIMSQDIDLFFRILESDINVLGHEDVVQFYRRHDRNMTLNEKKANLYHLKAFKKSLNRRRDSGQKLNDISSSINKKGSIIDFWN